MSLQVRLVTAVAAVVALGLAAAAVVIYTTVQAFLFDRVDEQLVQARAPATFELAHSDPARPSPRSGTDRGPAPPASGPGVPAGTYVERRNEDGQTVERATFAFGEETYGQPALADDDRPLGNATFAFFTVDADEGALRYRVLAEREPAGTTLFIAIPLTDVDSTLDRLRWILAAVLVGATLVVVSASALAIRLGLRPLHRMGLVAADIAEGNLALRLAENNPRTETGRLGAALNAMLDRLEQAFRARLATEERLRRFVADASHELRTPLTSIRGYTELFGRGARDDPQVLARVMHRIDEQSARMQALVEDLLLLARMDQERSLEFDPVDLAGLAEEGVLDARVQQPDRPLSFDAAGDCTVLGDRIRLHQVVGNLIGNALRHTPPGTPVEVSVRRSGAEVEFSVRDMGPGMTANHAAHVFEPFYRVDRGRSREHGGTGLGLAIVDAIVRGHGGQVVLDTNDGSGATFSVRLPVHVDPAGEAAAGV